MTAANADEQCQKWWDATTPTDGSASGQDVPDIFDVKGDAGWLSERAATADRPEAVRDFLTSLTGVNPWGGTTGVI